VVLIAGATFFRPAVQRLADRLVGLGAKLRLVRDPAATVEKLHTALEGYHANLIKTVKRPGELLAQLLLSAVSVASLMSVAVCVYYAFGLSDAPWQQLLALAYLLYAEVVDLVESFSCFFLLYWFIMLFAVGAAFSMYI
jgi:uncharacterized membrane protein YbhN (UPF0104 family)